MRRHREASPDRWANQRSDGRPLDAARSRARSLGAPRGNSLRCALGGKAGGICGCVVKDWTHGPPSDVRPVKTGYDVDRGPSWIGGVDFTRSWNTARYRGRELRRFQGSGEANFYDVASGEEFWLSGPKRDRTDARYGPATTEVDADARETYEAFLAGGSLTGRARS